MRLRKQFVFFAMLLFHLFFSWLWEVLASLILNALVVIDFSKHQKRHSCLLQENVLGKHHAYILIDAWKSEPDLPNTFAQFQKTWALNWQKTFFFESIINFAWAYFIDDSKLASSRLLTKVPRNLRNENPVLRRARAG